MDPVKKLLLVGWVFTSKISPLKEQLRRTCRRHQISFQVIDRSTPYPVMANEVRDADYCLVWHGSAPLSCWAVDVRRSLNKHCKIVEVGWFTQEGYWHIDPLGLSGKSSLCGELPEPSEESKEELELKRMDYQLSLDPLTVKELNLPDQYILCPFQVTHDSTVYYDAPFKFNQDFADHVMNEFPNDPIVFKTHPKQTRDVVRTERKDVYVVRQGNFIDYTVNAKLVYGQTSTTLVESALLGVPVEAIGNCPLYHHQSDTEETEKLLRVMLDRQIPRQLNYDMWKHIVD